MFNGLTLLLSQFAFAFQIFGEGLPLHDCYPAQFIDDERTQANIKKNAVQWETFTKYLEGKGKLR